MTAGPSPEVAAHGIPLVLSWRCPHDPVTTQVLCVSHGGVYSAGDVRHRAEALTSYLDQGYALPEVVEALYPQHRRLEVAELDHIELDQMREMLTFHDADGVAMLHLRVSDPDTGADHLERIGVRLRHQPVTARRLPLRRSLGRVVGSLLGMAFALAIPFGLLLAAAVDVRAGRESPGGRADFFYAVNGLIEGWAGPSTIVVIYLALVVGLGLWFARGARRYAQVLISSRPQAEPTNRST